MVRVFGAYAESFFRIQSSMRAGIVFSSAAFMSESRVYSASDSYRRTMPSLTRQSLCHLRSLSTNHHDPCFS
ncbi:hypothetical protein DF139_23965 [Burkholderia stagnalis]|nr:hypothetical protein DF137_24770 [Burkholderia stagnalis]RQQ65308.1 hypothetical protein DF139_23965 [Burkholderia stagnalis]RQQ77583.1 hypothetical protein DF138_24425 [Burkholderia stagnalis]RQQ86217.1 hypothetical protein DF136_23575 [Burkholderia stagnalis]